MQPQPTPMRYEGRYSAPPVRALSMAEREAIAKANVISVIATRPGVAANPGACPSARWRPGAMAQQ